MSKSVQLKETVSFGKKRVSINSVSIDNYVTTDNLLPNKLGVTRAVNLPPCAGNIPAYSHENILLANIRPYLKKIWFSDRSGGCSADVLVFQAKPGYFPKFIYYALFRDDFFSHVMKGAKGTKMPRGDKAQMLEFTMPAKGFNEQKKIAAVLSALDAKIDCNNRINAELEAMAKTLYDYWFVQFDFPDANGKPYRSSGGKMVYNATLKREIPAGWKEISLWGIARYFNGLAMQKFRPIGSDYLPVIKIKEMGEGLSGSTEKARPDIPTDAIVDDGDVLFSWSATLDVKIWSSGRGALNQHIFKVTSDKYPKTFYYFELLRYLAHFKMMAEKRKTTMGHITQDHLKQSRICIPPTELLFRAHEKIEPIFKKHLLHEKENQHLAQLRDWLLPLLMNGQVTVT